MLSLLVFHRANIGMNVAFSNSGSARNAAGWGPGSEQSRCKLPAELIGSFSDLNKAVGRYRKDPPHRIRSGGPWRMVHPQGTGNGGGDRCLPENPACRRTFRPDGSASGGDPGSPGCAYASSGGAGARRPAEGNQVVSPVWNPDQRLDARRRRALPLRPLQGSARGTGRHAASTGGG